MKNAHNYEKCSQRQVCGLCCTKIKNFGVTLGNTTILKDINLHIHCGELTAIIGPNGAGKSTLIKALLGEVAHTGSLKFVQAQKSAMRTPVIGYVPQSLILDSTSPTSVMDLFLSCRSLFPTWIVRRKKEVEMVKERLAVAKAEHLISRRLGALSGGELQRVLLALALDPIPDLLLLDEPVSGIDHNGLELFYETVSALREEYDLTVILVSHDLDMVQRYADRVVLLNQCILKVGSPDEVFDSQSFYDTYSYRWNKSKHTEGDKT